MGAGIGGARPLAVDRLFAAYLIATGGLALASWRPAGFVAAAAHGVAALAVILASRRPLPSRGWVRFLRVAYPLALTPALYAELAFLNQLLTSGYVDPLVQGWEEALFGAQISVEASRRLGAFWLSELLHLGYLTYYVIVPVALFGVFAGRGTEELHRVAFQTALAFFVSYVVFVLLPVAGPRYLFQPISGARAEGTLFGLVHAILEGGSSKGTAFPSSHIAASWAAVLACRRADRRWFWSLAFPAVALAAGTVYGRFHYGVDAAAGIVLALAVHAAVPGLVRRLGEWPAAAIDGDRDARSGNPARGPGIQSLG